MLPGHTVWIWMHPKYQELILRSALWLLKKPIPDNTAELVPSKSVHVKEVGGFGKEGFSTLL